uniref:Uncharacterized protein n=1 Tax=Glossina austeni TaxID=7395 RepID=A0A1A9V997_GLOAU
MGILSQSISCSKIEHKRPTDNTSLEICDRKTFAFRNELKFQEIPGKKSQSKATKSNHLCRKVLACSPSLYRASYFLGPFNEVIVVIVFAVAVAVAVVGLVTAVVPLSARGKSSTEFCA